ncbi:MAG: hypothetical protein ABI134_33565, partial [Byssovorax sp.]
NRGDLERGYTHIHGPRQPKGNGHCTTHTVTVEKQNGTVSVREPIAETMGATARAAVPIKQDPMGHSCGPEYGEFGFGFTAATLRGRGTLDDFAREVIQHAKSLPKPW